MNQFTIVDIIKRKINFTKTNVIYDKIEFKYYNEGELSAYSEMLLDIDFMSEGEFVGKYLDIIRKLKVSFDNREITDINVIEKKSGYNNAIVSILECINPKYMHDLND